jgi:hypothetical protein
VEAELKKLGLKRAKHIAKECQARKVSLAEVRDVISTYRAYQSRLGPGAIAYRLREGHWPDDSVVESSKRKQTARAKAQQDEAARDEARKHARQAEAERAKQSALYQELNGKYGPTLDNMPDSERQALINAMSKSDFEREVLTKSWRTNQLTRIGLFQAMEARGDYEP